jgi:hypothetical protein
MWGFGGKSQEKELLERMIRTWEDSTEETVQQVT